MVACLEWAISSKRNTCSKWTILFFLSVIVYISIRLFLTLFTISHVTVTRYTHRHIRVTESSSFFPLTIYRRKVFFVLQLLCNWIYRHNQWKVGKTTAKITDKWTSVRKVYFIVFMFTQVHNWHHFNINNIIIIIIITFFLFFFIGRPQPQVRWLVNGVLVDDQYEHNTGDVIENRLLWPAVQRSDLNAIFTCQAVNTILVEPKENSYVLDLHRK